MARVESPVTTLKTAHEIAFSPAEDAVAFIGGRDVTVLNLQTRAPLFVVHPIANPSHIDFAPDGSRLAVKGTSGRTIVLDAMTGKLVVDFQNKSEGEGDSALFSTSGQFVMSVSWNGLFSVRDSANGELVFSQKHESFQLTELSTTDDRSVFVYSTGGMPTSASGGLTPCNVVVQKWHGRKAAASELPRCWPAIAGMQISPSGRMLALVYGTPPNTLEIYDIDRSQTVSKCPWTLGGTGCSIHWTNDEKSVAVNADGKFLVLDLPTLSVRNELLIQYPCFVRFSKSGRHLALGSWKKSFVVPTDYLETFAETLKRAAVRVR